MISTPARFEPDHLGRYRILARLGHGGMGEVFLASLQGDGGFEKLVVLKRPLPHLLDCQDAIDMFLDEARIAASLNHHNVCQVYELHSAHGQMFLAMEYLRGLPLSELLVAAHGRQQALPVAIVAGIIAQVAEGLHHAHESRGSDGASARLVHRDIAPANIFLTTEGVAKVLDFGIAKTRQRLTKTHAGTMKGKVGYSSPEQQANLELDRRSDIFSLGVVFFEALTLRRLFRRRSDYDTLCALQRDRIPTVDEFRAVDGPLVDVVARALERERARRFATARELACAIQEAMLPVGGVASSLDIATYLQAEFGSELRAHDAAAAVRARRPVRAVGSGARAVPAYETGPATTVDAPRAIAAPTPLASPAAPATTARRAPRSTRVARSPGGTGVRIAPRRRRGVVVGIGAAALVAFAGGWMLQEVVRPSPAGAPEVRAALAACLGAAAVVEPGADPAAFAVEVDLRADGAWDLGRIEPRVSETARACAAQGLAALPGPIGDRARFYVQVPRAGR